MKVEDSFVIDEPRERLWEFFDDVERVARCVPGVESIEIIDPERSRIRVTQAVGPMTATFDLKMRVTERDPRERLRFTAVGRAVRGAAGNVRTTSTVCLAEVDGGTRVAIESELAMGGVLGSVGQKVVAKQAGEVTRQFSQALERAIGGEGPLQPSASAAGPDVATPPRLRSDLATRLGGAAVVLVLLLLVWRLARRARLP